MSRKRGTQIVVECARADVVDEVIRVVAQMRDTFVPSRPDSVIIMITDCDTSAKNLGVNYGRLSMDAEGSQSLETQVKECMAAAERRGVALVAVILDSDYSASKVAIQAKRPGMASVRKMLADGEADTVMFWKIDRAFRLLGAGHTFLAEIIELGVKRIISLMDSLDDNPAEMSVMMLMTGMLMGAQIEANSMKVRQLGRHRRVAELHAWPGGRVPLGYRVTRTARGVQVLEPHPVEAPAIRRAVDRILAGESVRALLRELTAVAWQDEELAAAANKLRLLGLDVEAALAGKASLADIDLTGADIADVQRTAKRLNHLWGRYNISTSSVSRVLYRPSLAGWQTRNHAAMAKAAGVSQSQLTWQQLVASCDRHPPVEEGEPGDLIQMWEPVLNAQTYYALQAELDRRAGNRAPRGSNDVLLLRGLLVHPVCGRTLHNDGAKNKSVPKYIHRNDRLEKSHCANCASVRAQPADAYVYAWMCRWLGPEVQAMLSSFIAPGKVDPTEDLVLQIKQVSATIQALVSMVGHGDRTIPELAKELDANQTLRSNLEAQLVKARAKADDARSVENSLAGSKLEDVWDTYTPEQRNNLARSLIEKIEVRTAAHPREAVARRMKIIPRDSRIAAFMAAEAEQGLDALGNPMPALYRDKLRRYGPGLATAA